MTEVEEFEVLQNSDFLHQTKIEWINEIPYQEPNEYEIKMLEGTKNPKELILEEQKEDPLFLTDEELKEREKSDYIQRVKVIALHMCNKPILSNPTFFKQIEKNKIIKSMQSIIDNMTNEDIITRFNEICSEEIFSGEGDCYERYGIKRS
jgi:hypothetical protein